MSDIAILKEMIKEEATEPLENDGYGKNKVILREKASDYFVTIGGMPDDDEVIIINADKFKSPDTIFQGNNGECKRADFIIVANTSRKKIILYIEMKRRKGKSQRDIIEQLNGAYCFVAYCREIGQLFWSQQNFIQDYENRFISITNITNKYRTRIERTHDSPSNIKLPQKSGSSIKLLRRSGSSYQFNDLAHCQK